MAYLGEYDFGLWITIYGMFLWVNGFDFGISNGFRNNLSVAFASQNSKLAKSIVSTAYFCLGGYVFLLFLTSATAISLWDYFGQTPISENGNSVFSALLVLLVFVSVEIVAKLSIVVYTANQNAVVQPLVTALNTLLSLFVAFCLNKTGFFIFDSRFLTYALFSGFVPVLTNFLATISLFSCSYVSLKPKMTLVSSTLIRDIFYVGSKFFVIQVCMIFLLQFTNLMVSAWVSPAVVSKLAVLDKYFGIISILGSVVLFPFWSKFTKAETLKNYDWILKTLLRLEVLFFGAVFFAFVLLFVFPWVVRIWISEDAASPLYIAILFAAKYLAILLNSIYCYYLNGINRLKEQIIMYGILAALNVPVSHGLFILFGVAGLVAYVPLAMFIMAFYMRLVVHNHLEMQKQLV